MIRILFTAAILSVVPGCANEPGHLAVGQPWDEAVDSIRKAGYVLNDGNSLQMEPAPAAFIELDGDQALIINRDTRTGTVSSLQRYTRWSKGKRAEANAPVDEFPLRAKR